MKLYISVNKHIIAYNKKNGTNNPPYEIRKTKDDPAPMRVHEATFAGTVKLVYNEENPLISNACCWLEIDLDA